MMNTQLQKKLIYEFVWLVGLLSVSAVIEYIALALFDLHPMLSVKIQGIIGLTIIGYGVRVTARVIGEAQESSEQNDKDEVDQSSKHR